VAAGLAVAQVVETVVAAATAEAMEEGPMAMAAVKEVAAAVAVTVVRAGETAAAAMVADPVAVLPVRASSAAAPRAHVGP